MYDFHKKEFGLEDNTFLRLFEKLLSEPPCSTLECSVQITPRNVHAARLRLGYQKEDIQKGLEASYRFLHGIEARAKVLLNRKILDSIVDKELSLFKILQMGMGLDYREDLYDSKVKYYFMICEYPEKENQVLSLHPLTDTVDAYLKHSEFMFGINLHFDGRTDVEIYHLFERCDLRDGALIEKLDLRDPVLAFIEECSGFHISFHTGEERVFHFHPTDSTKFIHFIDNRRLSLLYSNVHILRYLLDSWKSKEGLNVCISLLEDEVVAENIQNINLQYALSHRTWI
jgi:LynF/TruF/PatF family peptide O-prenyltransferase